MEYPRLIESQTRNYLLDTLKHCHQQRTNLYLFTWNLLIFSIFVTVLGITLYLCAKNKKYSETNRNKLQSDQEYILSKIREMREIENYQHQLKNLTGLPNTLPVAEHSSGYSY